MRKRDQLGNAIIGRIRSVARDLETGGELSVI